MTLARIRDQARRLSRINSTWTSGDGTVTDAHVNDLIQQAIYDFSIDVDGLPMQDFIALDADFTTRTTMGIHVTVTDSGGTDLVDEDVTITATDRDEVAGSTVASDLQTAIRAATGALGTETVVWASFYFTIDFKQGATFTITAPTSVTLSDASEKLGLVGFSTASTVITGTFPEDCTLSADLPSDVITMDRVEWDGWEVVNLPIEHFQSPEAQGRPWAYYVRGRELFLTPTPTSQGNLHVWYRGTPTDVVFAGYQECGLSSISDEKSTGLSTSTQYYYKVTINGQQTEYNITTASDVTYSAVIALMNAQNTGATFSIVGGDLRCTSDAIDGVSTIALAAGTSGTDLFATLTGFSAFETAVAGDINPPTEIPAAYHQAIVWKTAKYLSDETTEYNNALYAEAQYKMIKNSYLVHRSNMNTEINTGHVPVLNVPRITMP